MNLKFKEFLKEMEKLDYSWDEINEFISEVRGIARENLGPDYSDPAFDE